MARSAWRSADSPGQTEIGVLGHEPLFEGCDGTLKQRNRFGKASHAIQQATEIVPRQSRVRRQLLLDGQRSPVVLLRILVIAAGVVLDIYIFFALEPNMRSLELV